MGEIWRRVRKDLEARRNIDAYVTSGIMAAFALLSIFGDVVSGNLKWAATLAGIGILVFRLTIPARIDGDFDTLLNDRSAFDEMPLASRLERSREVWIYAPSAINILAPQNCDTLRKLVLARADGSVKVVVLDDRQEAAVQLAVQQLDESLDFPVQRLRPSLAATTRQLREMATWAVAGDFQYGFLNYNPGFSLVVIDPGEPQGTVIVEFHGFHNEATTSRMHIELRRKDSERWFVYWVSQFEEIWRASYTSS